MLIKYFVPYNVSRQNLIILLDWFLNFFGFPHLYVDFHMLLVQLRVEVLIVCHKIDLLHIKRHVNLLPKCAQLILADDCNILKILLNLDIIDDLNDPLTHHQLEALYL
jgi:hypothetical protein